MNIVNLNGFDLTLESEFRTDIGYGIGSTRVVHVDGDDSIWEARTIAKAK